MIDRLFAPLLTSAGAGKEVETGVPRALEIIAVLHGNDHLKTSAWRIFEAFNIVRCLFGTVVSMIE